MIAPMSIPLDLMIPITEPVIRQATMRKKQNRWGKSMCRQKQRSFPQFMAREFQKNPLRDDQGSREKKMQNFFCGFFLIALALSKIGFSEASHAENSDRSNRNRTNQRSLVEVLSFSSQFQREWLSNPEDPTKSIQAEYGFVLDSNGENQKAIRVYSGQKGHPTGNLDLFARQAGKARTLVAAKKACEKLIPLGKWRLATLPQVMGFFTELAPAFPLPQDPRKKGFLFWASSGVETKDRENKEAFFSAWEGEDSKLETHLFSEFQMKVKMTIARSQSKEEKSYYTELLKKTRDGIATVCVLGDEP